MPIAVKPPAKTECSRANDSPAALELGEEATRNIQAFSLQRAACLRALTMHWRLNGRRSKWQR